MAARTKIEWTNGGSTWTPIRAKFWEIQNDGSGKERIGWHCEHVSEGCRFCYAENMNMRLGTGLEFKPGNLYCEEKKGYRNGESRLFLDEKMLTQPIRWKRGRVIFVCSMTDLFGFFVPDSWIDKIFAVMALCQQHVFIVLTKRSARMLDHLSNNPNNRTDGLSTSECVASERWKIAALPQPLGNATPWPLQNVVLMVSAEDQRAADEHIPHLLRTPAAVRGVSVEPMLGEVNLRPYLEGVTLNDWLDESQDQPRLDWAICGGESGPFARPMKIEWERDLRDQCVSSSTPFFLKQRLEGGKKISMPLLDGRTWAQTPPIFDRMHNADRF
jgi:protein gp37